MHAPVMHPVKTQGVDISVSQYTGMIVCCRGISLSTRTDLHMCMYVWCRLFRLFSTVFKIFPRANKSEIKLK